MNIVTRYLFQEILKSSAATVLILFVILMSNALGRVLSDIAGGEVPYQALWPLMLSQSVNIFSLLLPIGLFFGIVLAFGRLYKDHEIVVMNACGVGYIQFYKPVLLIILPAFFFNAYCSIWLNSQTQSAAYKIVELRNNAQEFDHLKPGQFNVSKNGEHVFFMESIDADRRQLNNIIVSETNRDGMFLETAKSGRQKTDDLTGNLFMVVGPGQIYEGEPGEKTYKIVEFEQHGILIEKKEKAGKQKLRDRAIPPHVLWKSSRPADRVELHWRIAIPIVLVVLAMLAVPLSHMAPRQGRYGKVGYALIIYIIYFNLMVYTRAQLNAESLPVAINFWWVHFLFIALTLDLLIRRNGGYRFSKRIIGR
ncbi:MAG: LPS export ABC transporter permease LptF [Gammaproteobacteria bacterium]